MRTASTAPSSPERTDDGRRPARTPRPARAAVVRLMGLYEDIVVGTDGSVTASEAVRRAVELGRATGAAVHVVYIGAAERADNVLRQALEPYPDDDLRPVHREGDPAEMLVATAKELGAGCIVVGNRGMQGPRRFVLGSVPNTVSHTAPCDVLIAATS